ncbi:MAG: pyruvate formate lyase family protein [Armatimonadia bacterium]
MSTVTTTNWALLEDAGEPLAAAFMAHWNDPPLLRACQALKRFFETCALPEYGGEALYPCSAPLYSSGQTATFHYSGAMCFNLGLLDEKIAQAERPEVREALALYRAAVADYPPVQGYTHSIINFGRMLREGLGGYRARVERLRSEARAEEKGFHEAMLVLLEGIEALVGRVVAHLRASGAPAELVAGIGKVVGDNGLGRLKRGPSEGPEEERLSFYEAVVGTNFLFYLDGCDDLGRFDQELWGYYRDDLASGAMTRDEAKALVSQLFENVDTTFAWNCAIGGTAPDASSGCNDLTLVCLEVAKGRRRPNLALRLRKDTPKEYWEQALETISGGSGIPALYNEEEYLAAMAHADLGVAEDDLPWYAFGGCTELMVHGRSNVGSLDDTFNLAVTLEQSLHRHLALCGTFEEFMGRLREDISRDIHELCERVDGYQRTKAQWQPQPIRTLLVDDCLDNATEYNAGGARYNWSVINVAGLPNTYDSLAAVKKVIYDEGDVTADELLVALKANFEGQEALRLRLSRCPHFGNDDPYVDELATEVSTHVFSEFMQHTPWRGGRYLASCLMFVTYGYFGTQVGATPDGRLAQTPIADSAGAVQGRDRSGPTALLRSMTKVPHFLAPGTLVHNIRFTKRLFNDPAARAQLQALIRTYFDLGGMQLQINVVDQQVLRDAMEHPENYRDLIIRVGGYSEYFNLLGRDLQLTVLERVEHDTG